MAKNKTGFTVTYDPAQCHYVVQIAGTDDVDEFRMNSFIEARIADGTLARADIDFTDDGDHAFRLGTLEYDLPVTDTTHELCPHLEQWFQKQLVNQN